MSFPIPLATSPLANEENVSTITFPMSVGVLEMLHWMMVSLSRTLSIGIKLALKLGEL